MRPMKKTTAQRALAVLFAVGVIVNIAMPVYADNQPSCSRAGAAGTYGVSDSGTVIGIGPRSAVALLTLDETGNIKGGVTASLNGAVSNTTLSGTYTVDHDCTGTTTFGEYDSSGNLLIIATVALVWDADMSEFRFLFTSAVLADGTPLTTVISGDARKK